MKMIFATKRDINGNRYFLTVDYEAKTFSRADRWSSSDDIPATKSIIRRLVIQLKDAGYIEADS